MSLFAINPALVFLPPLLLLIVIHFFVVTSQGHRPTSKPVSNSQQILVLLDK
jgi:hypothetical protein